LYGGQEALYASHFHEYESSLVWEFNLFCEILKNLGVWRSTVAAEGLAADQSSGGEKNGTLYSFFYIFIIITIISSSIYFVVLLNSLYLKP